MRLSYPFADACVAVSNGGADDTARLSGLPRSRFTVISNPIDFPSKLERRPEIEALWGNCSKRILTVGHLKAEKNHALLVRAFARLPKVLDAKLMIAGDGKLLVELTALAQREGVADRVIFPGFLPDPWPLYASADLFALSSRQESFGNVLVEALYAELPIVSTDNIGAREVLEGERWGRIVAQDQVDEFAVALVEQLGKVPDSDSIRRRAIALSGEGPIRAYLSLLLPASSGPENRSVATAQTVL
jgi:glycosyltransferase involved in cell wall biosynthesis